VTGQPRPSKSEDARDVPLDPLADSLGATGGPRSGAAPGSPPGQRVRGAADAWLEIDASPWVRRALRFGLELLWQTPRGRPRRPTRPHPVSKKDSAFVAEEVGRWTAAGSIRPLIEAELSAATCVFPAFVSWARKDKPRLVVDLRHVNEHLQDTRFKNEALKEFLAALQPHDNLMSWDMEDAYHPTNLAYLTFAIEGRALEPVTMLLGLSVAPWTWIKVMRPMFE